MSDIFSSINSFTHNLLRNIIHPDDLVIDATVGNGNDTLFLARQVDGIGRVFGFDIQKDAILNTAALLSEHGLLDIVSLFHDGHENMLKYITKPVKAVIFNLGYLPKSDHKIITLPNTTISAIEQATRILLPGGIITITVYPGHQGGEKEKEAVELFVQHLDKKNWDVLSWSFLNRSASAPYLIVIHRRGGLTD